MLHNIQACRDCIWLILTDSLSNPFPNLLLLENLWDLSLNCLPFQLHQKAYQGNIFSLGSDKITLENKSGYTKNTYIV